MPTLRRVTTISLATLLGHERIQFHHLRSALEACPNLTNLIIKWNISWHQRLQESNSRPITLPHLKHFAWVDMPDMLGGGCRLDILFNDFLLPEVETITFRDATLFLLHEWATAVTPAKPHFTMAFVSRDGVPVNVGPLVPLSIGRPVVKFPRLSTFRFQGSLACLRDERDQEDFFATLSSVANIYLDASCVLDFLRSLVETINRHNVWPLHRRQQRRLIIPRWSSAIDYDELVSLLASPAARRQFSVLCTGQVDFERYCLPAIQMELRELVDIEFEEPDESLDWLDTRIVEH
ncbi:hypothetical protein GLOTRDRAFT_132528 [Gloeophyllum trabeum ATCC 11539]|uniref:Uncharacterized protein n=1 Tax=Gloeophyllum trabeum (strain ATCC 11539 / FP-39264 / Madison 617) TaxID=670483 RepID=S7PW12_GLOTA|nr:uncharacterized protein GLOTRDRAFT_132528 [Gloeophyllum trabeum ATCC 11539]EPQ51708.1 hypothetical protein GLOTRDRAFT_132528 [Gloeophyllum trabeum ATCC 11539]